MSEPTRRVQWTVWIGLLLVVAAVLLASLYAAVKVRTALGKPLPMIGPVADFTLTNQNGQAVSLADLRGHVWVADVIFTRCPGPCLRMTRQMQELQMMLPAGGDVRLVSLTTDPEYDSPGILKKYAEKFGVETNRWMFLTGTKKQIANLAIDSLKLTAIEKKPEERQSTDDLFVHSTIFVVVDRQAQLRGVFETSGEGIDEAQVKGQVLAAVRRLQHER